MLTHLQFSYEIKEKIIRSKDGRSARVRYAVTEIDGQMYWKVISMQTIGELTGLRGKSKDFIQYLPLLKTRAKTTQPQKNGSSVASPFVSSVNFFFMSQLTRAPAK